MIFVKNHNSVYCPKCGKEISNEFTYCPFCGIQVRIISKIITIIIALELLSIILLSIGLGFVLSGVTLFVWEEKVSLADSIAYKIVFPYQHLGIFMWARSVIFFISGLLIGIISWALRKWMESKGIKTPQVDTYLKAQFLKQLMK
jgi:hypothetical protein